MLRRNDLTFATLIRTRASALTAGSAIKSSMASDNFCWRKTPPSPRSSPPATAWASSSPPHPNAHLVHRAHKLLHTRQKRHAARGLVQRLIAQRQNLVHKMLQRDPRKVRRGRRSGGGGTGGPRGGRRGREEARAARATTARVLLLPRETVLRLASSSISRVPLSAAAAYSVQGL
jgi:hypothetical protein